MTKKDFELIASILLYNKPSYTAKPKDYSARVEKWRSVCESFAQELSEKYRLFQKDKFLKACGVELGKNIELIKLQNSVDAFNAGYGKNKRGVFYCKHAKTMVEQELLDNGCWMCLH